MPFKDKEKQKASSRKHYSLNKLKYQANRKDRKEFNFCLVASIKQQISCTDCFNYYPHYIMDFDHVVSDEKVGNIANMVKDGNMLQIIQELKKCDIVCSNCHRQRTYSRLQNVP